MTRLIEALVFHSINKTIKMLQVKGIPFLVFDAGGVLEMFDSKAFADNVVFEPTLAALKRKLSSVVSIAPWTVLVTPV